MSTELASGVFTEISNEEEQRVWGPFGISKAGLMGRWLCVRAGTVKHAYNNSAEYINREFVVQIVSITARHRPDERLMLGFAATPLPVFKRDDVEYSLEELTLLLESGKPLWEMVLRKRTYIGLPFSGKVVEDREVIRTYTGVGMLQ